MKRAVPVRGLRSCLSALAMAAACASPALADKDPPPQLVVTSAISDFDALPCLLTLRGRNFGDDPPEVRLGDEDLILVAHGDSWAIAEFDCSTPPGDYLLAVQRGPSNTGRDVLSLTLGAVGPVGPEGPAGPAGPAGVPGPEGPAGPSASGAVTTVEASFPLALSVCDPPTIVPGLDTTLNVGAGSRLLVLLESRHYEDCHFSGSDHWARLDIWVDSSIVASREIGREAWNDPVEDWTGVVLSRPLSAGPHRVRVELTVLNPHGNTDCRDTAPCVGAPGDRLRTTTLTVIEQRP